ncbi:hypothetical protein D3C76_1446810 [compost metagenome]
MPSFSSNPLEATILHSFSYAHSEDFIIEAYNATKIFAELFNIVSAVKYLDRSNMSSLYTTGSNILNLKSEMPNDLKSYSIQKPL